MVCHESYLPRSTEIRLLLLLLLLAEEFRSLLFVFFLHLAGDDVVTLHFAFAEWKLTVVN
jgi:hypothetical protein